MAKRSRKGKKKGFGAAEVVVLCVAALVFVVSAIQLGRILLEYKAGTDAYDSLSDQFTVKGEAFLPKEEEDGETTVMTKEEFPDIEVDFAALEEMNPDFVAWLYVPVLDIEYPVVLGSDNEYYLTHTFEKKENKAGAIFMDSVSSPDFTDYNTFLYGHNMKNGSMFGKLKKFIQDEELCAQEPYIFLYTQERTYRYQIISYYVTTDGSRIYYCPGNEEDYEAYRSMVLKNSHYEAEAEYPADGTMLTLSTCYGQAGGEQRFVVHAVLDKTKENRG